MELRDEATWPSDIDKDARRWHHADTDAAQSVFMMASWEGLSVETFTDPDTGRLVQRIGHAQYGDPPQ